MLRLTVGRAWISLALMEVMAPARSLLMLEVRPSALTTTPSSVRDSSARVVSSTRLSDRATVMSLKTASA